MPKDLFCPLEDNCKINRRYLSYVSSIEYDKLIRGGVNGYSCRALNRVNSYERKNDECALIQLLNNTDVLLNLTRK